MTKRIVMVEFNIRDINVHFPFPPYECQLDYMDKVIQALEEGKNALLESPTGTGKTLCLLCASFAWQDHFLAKLTNELSEDFNKWSAKSKTGVNIQSARLPYGVPKIIYSSRTHSQLSQCMKALQNTHYCNRKVTIMASREQLCVNNAVSSLETTSAQIFGCRYRLKTRSCHYYNNFDKNREKLTSNSNTIIDIEDLVIKGRSNHYCPYYLTKELQNSAKMIFMPYNYLLDPRIRRRYNIDLNNSIIIFDEAHNIEQVCEDSASVDLTSTSIALCIEELRKLGEYLYDNQIDNDNNILENIEEQNKNEIPDIEQILYYKEILIKFELLFNQLIINDIKNGLTEKPQFLFNLFIESGLQIDFSERMVDCLDCCITYISMGNDNASLRHIGARGLDNVSNFIRTIFCDNFDSQGLEGLSQTYRVHVRDEQVNTTSVSKLSVWEKKKSNNPTKVRTVSFWCLTPGRTMSGLVKDFSIRSIILTSGTLYPIETLKSDMKIDFELELQNSHVINPDQILVNVCSKGPDGVPLNSSYEFREEANYNNSLGNTIVSLAKYIPKGLLVVFPSYSMMKKCIEKWQNSDIYNRMVSQKQVIIEPQDKQKFSIAMKHFETANTKDDSSGAVLLAVARGKVTEGLDLSNDRGRGVIVIGLPFPAMMDPRIRIKMEFLDEQVVQKEHATISGRAWYRQQAYRAVNQAIGRVIRHSQDYGCIYLCDERFVSAASRAEFPNWIQPKIEICADFGKVVKLTTQFFKTIPMKYQYNPTKFFDQIHTKTPENSLEPVLIQSSSKKKLKSRKTIEFDLASKVNTFCYSMETKDKEDVPGEFSELIQDYSTVTSSQSNVENTDAIKKKGLMDILNEAKIKEENTSSENSDENYSNQVTINRSKIMIARKRPLNEIDNNISKDDLKLSSQSKPKKKYKLIHRNDSDSNDKLKEYMCRVKSSLNNDNESIEKFHKFLEDYQKSKNIKLLAENMHSLFQPLNALRLITDYEQFLSDKSIRLQFRKYLLQFNVASIKSMSVSPTKPTVPSQPSNQHTTNDSNNRCAKCGVSPIVMPLAAPCKHICCFHCWRTIMDDSVNLVQKCCPTCGKLTRRRNLVKLF